MATPKNNEDQKKRTLDALELRFKQAEAEVRFQQQKDKKRPLEEKVKLQRDNKSPRKDASTVALNVPRMKGNVIFIGHAVRQDLDLSNTAYSELFHPVNENLATADKITNPKSTVDYILHDYFQHGDVAPKFLQGRINETDKILLDNYEKKGGMSGAAQSRAPKRHAKQSKKHASHKQHKKLGSFDLPTEYHNFDLFRPLHDMWKSYITQLVKIIGKDQLGKCLLNADLHGAIILVADCKVSALRGVRGIVIRDSAETFGIITQDNKFRVVPKKLSVFMLQAESWKVTLHGDKLSERSMVP
ncbi:endoribonuclease [Lithospermum erythrorhizon]|uniref:Endoribonuclease n=1 Tax=Lithospermum erythrorhizon TaxID=34254 RepID=A0AAV3Q6H2_LITER